MKLLSEALPDAELSQFYRDLLAAEARHFHSYLEMALGRFPRAEVLDRLRALAAHEAAVLEQPCETLRLHSAALETP